MNKLDSLRDIDNEYIQSCFQAASDKKVKYQSTNNLMIFKQEGKNGKKGKNTLYMPGYLTANLKNMTLLDIQSLSGRANIKLFFKIFYGDLFIPNTKFEQEQFKKQKQQILKVLMNKINLNFVRDQAIVLTEKDQEQQIGISITHNEDQRMIEFSIHKIYYLNLDSDVFWSPFQIINGILQVTVQPVTIKTSKFNQKGIKQSFNVQFNLMDHQYQNLKISFTNWSTFGNYDLAERLLASFYPNYRVNSAKWFKLSSQQRALAKFHIFQKPDQNLKQSFFEPFKQNIKKFGQTFYNFVKGQQLQIESKAQKVEAFHYAYFNVPLYKYPFSSLATIFFPLWLLSIINLGIFYDEQKLSNRIVCIAAIMLAFVQLIPTIRSQIPPGSKFLFVQFLVYLESLTTMLALFDSLNVRDITGYDLNWAQSGFYITSVVVTIITFAIVLTLFIIHKVKWQPFYNLKYLGQRMRFIRKHWHNLQSDIYFSLKFNMERQQGQNYIVLTKKSLNENQLNEQKLNKQQTITKDKNQQQQIKQQKNKKRQKRNELIDKLIELTSEQKQFFINNK